MHLAAYGRCHCYYYSYYSDDRDDGDHNHPEVSVALEELSEKLWEKLAWLGVKRCVLYSPPTDCMTLRMPSPTLTCGIAHLFHEAFQATGVQ